VQAAHPRRWWLRSAFALLRCAGTCTSRLVRTCVDVAWEHSNANKDSMRRTSGLYARAAVLHPDASPHHCSDSPRVTRSTALTRRLLHCRYCFATWREGGGGGGLGAGGGGSGGTGNAVVGGDMWVGVAEQWSSVGEPPHPKWCLRGMRCRLPTLETHTTGTPPLPTRAHPRLQGVIKVQLNVGVKQHRHPRSPPRPGDGRGVLAAGHQHQVVLQQPWQGARAVEACCAAQGGGISTTACQPGPGSHAACTHAPHAPAWR
jgi:hypothetical protein